MLPSCKGEKVEAVENTEKKKYFLEKVENIKVVQYYCDDFDDLTLQEKILAYYLYEAALWGRDIKIDQGHRDALEIRKILEAVITHSKGIDPGVLEDITLYTKLFWLNNGMYNNNTSRKIVPRCTFDAFVEAALTAQKNGATFPAGDIKKRLQELKKIIFYPDHETFMVNKNPGPGKDKLLESAVNFYVDVSEKDLEGFTEKYPLNSRLVKNPDGSLAEEVYRIGDGKDIPPGKYAEYLEKINLYLEKAAAVAPPKTARALELLRTFFMTGDPGDFRAYNIAWVQDKSFKIDAILGFIEVYMDPRAAKGEFEAVIQLLNQDESIMMEKIAANARYFEQKSPWEDKFKSEEFSPRVATAIHCIVESGGAAPLTPVGINLPNDPHIRADYGSKSVILSNINEAYHNARVPGYFKEFCWDDEEIELAEKYETLGWKLEVALHEIIGHGSGKVQVEGDPHKYLSEYYNTLEETRADLVALYFLFDEKLKEIGAFENEKPAVAAYKAYARNVILQLRRIKEGDQLEDDHMRNRQLVVNYIMDNTDAIEVEKRNGKTYYRLVNPQKMREAIGTLLGEVMRIKGEGDYEAAGALIEKYGVKIDTALRDEVVRRCESIGMADYAGFVQPKLEPVYDDSGEIIDVKISYPCDLTAQMLEYSEKYSF